MPETWTSVFQTIVLILAVGWGLALLVPGLTYLTSRADSRAKLAKDRDNYIIAGTALPAPRGDG